MVSEVVTPVVMNDDNDRKYQGDIVKVEGASMRKNGDISCRVFLTGGEGESFEFLASERDCMQHGRELHRDLMDGKYGAVAPYDSAAIEKDRVQHVSGMQNYVLDMVEQEMSTLRDKVMLGMATDDERERMMLLVRYRDDVSAIIPEDKESSVPDYPSTEVASR